MTDQKPQTSSTKGFIGLDKSKKKKRGVTRTVQKITQPQHTYQPDTPKSKPIYNTSQGSKGTLLRVHPETNLKFKAWRDAKGLTTDEAINELLAAPLSQMTANERSLYDAYIKVHEAKLK